MSLPPKQNSSGKHASSISIVNEESKTASHLTCPSALTTVGRVLVLHLLNAANMEKVLEAVAHLGARLLDHYHEDEMLSDEESRPASPSEEF